MLAKTVSLVLRAALAAGILWLALVLAEALDGVVVTAPALTLLVAAAMSYALVIPGLLRLAKPDRGGEALPASALVGMGGTGLSALPALAHDREERARHEAAHAVAVHALGHRLVSLSIRPLGDSGGRTAWRHRDDAPASVDHVAVSFAGPLADGRRTPSRPMAVGSDDQSRLLHDAIGASLADPRGRSPVEIIEVGTRLARRILAEHEAVVEDLARLLVETEEKRDLQADELAAFMREHGVVPAPDDLR